MIRYAFPIAIVFVHAAFGRANDPTTTWRWEFGPEATEVFASHGNVLRDQAGPRSPEFPDFQADNTSIGLGDAVGHLSVDDPGDQSEFDFTNGDALTLEAWVHLENSVHGAPIYVVGKGRTGNPHYSKDNQNWSLRLQKSDDGIHVGFLFATQRTTGDRHWHRWTSHQSFPVGPSNWHHVAVSYRFGDPGSIRGWIDGQPSDGNWDMGGATTEPPIVDNDQVWIGSANRSNRFVGRLDNVAIHRAVLSDQELASRFRRLGGRQQSRLVKAEMPELGRIPKGQVLVTLAEGFPAEDRWPYEGEPSPVESMRWLNESFLIHRLPIRYDDWGIRDAWKEPVLLRLAADVPLSSVTHRLILRARGMGRLWIDGALIAATKPVTGKSPDGEQPITPVARPPFPGVRRHGYHQQEVFADDPVPGGTTAGNGSCRVVLEVVIGGKGQRTETGEVCVAVQTEDSRAYNVLTATGADPLPLTDEAVEKALIRLDDLLTSIDDSSRRNAAASQNEFWDQRHRVARDWAAQHRKEADYLSTETQHPIDVLIADKIERAVQAASSSDPSMTQHFYEGVLPILRDHCFRCHGEKEKGGLKLNSRDAALGAGDSEQPAIVPGNPDASELITQVRNGSMPPTESGLTEQQIGTLEQWIRDGAVWPAPPLNQRQIAVSPIIGDESFLRRVYFDTVGVPPTIDRARRFLEDDRTDKRERLIDELLMDPRFADHWISDWQDMLAENPTLLNQSMGSTGPFRWFLYESLKDNKPLDRMVTELIMMRGNPDTGGSAGFGLSGESDAPFAEKAHVIAGAFLGIELQCARCHDSPYHSTTQRDLYSLAAMLERKSVKVPSTSRVPDAFFERKGRESLIQVTLKPDESVAPQWPLGRTLGSGADDRFDRLMMNPDDTRERLAALITAPQNQRFSRVMVNRVWKKLIGAGIVEPVNDWEGRAPSHPRLLDWLVHELVLSGYDIRVVIRQIMTSKLYQREALGENLVADSEQRYFAAPDRRRLSAEQIVDALHSVTESEMTTEELTFVHDGQRPLGKRQTLGRPDRAWMFASLNNERDRPSLSLPRARAITDVLQAFGWSGSRQKPIHVRDTDPNVLQPGALSNGTLAISLTRAALNSVVSERAIQASSPETLVDEWFLRILSRLPTSIERQSFSEALGEGFDSRLVPQDQITYPAPVEELPLVTWFNHLQSETSTIQKELERRVSAGPPVDPRLEPSWRVVYEDFIWSLINHREFVWIP